MQPKAEPKNEAKPLPYHVYFSEARIGDALAAAHHAADKGQNDEDDRHPEEDARSFRRDPGDAAETEKGGDECNDKEDNRPVEKVAHDLLVYRTPSATL
jgi:hypothetical protein